MNEGVVVEVVICYLVRRSCAKCVTFGVGRHGRGVVWCVFWLGRCHRASNGYQFPVLLCPGNRSQHVAYYVRRSQCSTSTAQPWLEGAPAVLHGYRAVAPLWKQQQELQ